MMTEIRKPINPITKTPSADIFAIDLNSCEFGFLSICHTLTHFAKKLVSFSLSVI